MEIRQSKLPLKRSSFSCQPASKQGGTGGFVGNINWHSSGSIIEIGPVARADLSCTVGSTLCTFWTLDSLYRKVKRVSNSKWLRRTGPIKWTNITKAADCLSDIFYRYFSKSPRKLKLKTTGLSTPSQSYTWIFYFTSWKITDTLPAFFFCWVTKSMHRKGAAEEILYDYSVFMEAIVLSKVAGFSNKFTHDRLFITTAHKIIV